MRDLIEEHHRLVSEGELSCKMMKTFLSQAKTIADFTREDKIYEQRISKRRSYKLLVASIIIEKIYGILLLLFWVFPPFIVLLTMRWDKSSISHSSLIHWALPSLGVAVCMSLFAIIYLVYFRYKNLYLDMLDELLCSRLPRTKSSEPKNKG